MEAQICFHGKYEEIVY